MFLHAGRSQKDYFRSWEHRLNAVDSVEWTPYMKNMLFPRGSILRLGLENDERSDAARVAYLARASLVPYIHHPTADQQKRVSNHFPSAVYSSYEVQNIPMPVINPGSRL